MPVPGCYGNNICKIPACRIADCVDLLESVSSAHEVDRREDLIDYLRQIRIGHQRVVDVYYGDIGLYRQMHAEVLIELFEAVNECSAVDQDEAFFRAVTIERRIDIELQGMLSVLVFYVRFRPAFSGKDFILESGRVKPLAIPDECQSVLFCFVTDERIEHRKSPPRYVTSS